MRRQTLALLSSTLGTQRALEVFRFGPEGGPRVHIQAALHADETPAMLVAWTLKRELEALEQAGRLRAEVVLVPVANPIGLDQHVLGQFVGRFELEHGRNFNRGFATPRLDLDALAADLGDDGAANLRRLRRALQEALAAQAPRNEYESLQHHLYGLALQADLVLDLHCSLEACLHLYADAGARERIEALAAYLGAEATLLTGDSGGQSFDEAHSLLWTQLADAMQARGIALAPIPVAVTLEHRGQRDVDYEQSGQDARAILHYLTHLGWIAGEAPPLPPLPQAPTPLAGSEQFHAPRSGVLVYRSEVGARVAAGAPVFDVVDPLSGVCETVCSATAGVLYMRRATRFVRQGQPVARVTGARAQRTGKLIGD